MSGERGRPRPRGTVRRPARPQSALGGGLVALLCAVLGFATVVQVRSRDDTVLDRSRRTDLVQILDEVTQRSDRLRAEELRLRETRDELLNSASRSDVAREEATARERTLSVLAGTVPVTGPGIVMTLTDPQGRVGAAGLLGAVQELRAADAEAVEIAGANGRAARVVVSTAFVGTDTGVAVDGVDLTSPYRITAVGDADSLSGAMSFPRGVVAQVTGDDVGGTADVRERAEVTVEAVATLGAPGFASPVPEPSP
jgi:uncharacterized protein YlxW (UPF0749 family)